MVLQKTDVKYGEDVFAVNHAVYEEIKSKHKAIDSMHGATEAEKEVAREWITYNALFDDGHFISKPAGPEPSLAKVFAADAAVQTEDIPYESLTREEILVEREKLLKREAQVLAKEKRAFLNAVKAQKAQPKFDPKIYNLDGTEWGVVDWAKFIAMAIVLICIFSAITDSF